MGVSRVLAGASRTLGEEVKRAAPLLPLHLLSIFNELSEAPIHNMLRAAMLTSFRALLRKQNITQSDVVLRRRNFKFYPSGMLVQVEKSKTIQRREKLLQLPVTYCLDRHLCAVYWTKRHFLEVPMGQDSPAFCIPQVVPVPLDYVTYQQMIKFFAEMGGLDPTEFSSHSMRRGGTTFLWLTGASKEEIQARGDWSSDCYKIYLASPLEERISRDIQVSATVCSVVAGH